MDLDLSDRVVVITGASRGLGRALAAHCSSEGASLGLLARNAQELKTTADSLPVKTVTIGCDVVNEEQLHEAFERIHKELGRIDSVVANAGGQLAADRAEDLPLNKWRDTIELNLTGSYNTARAAYKYLQESHGGRMVFVSSGAAKHPLERMAPYAAAKAGVEGLMRALCVEWSQDQICVNAVSPGLIDSAGSRQIPERLKQRILAKTSLGRIGSVACFTTAVLFLLSDVSEFITGQVISVDGGYGLGGKHDGRGN